MRTDKRGEGGFMGSILAVMVVVISLTAFLSFLALSTMQQDEKEIRMPTELLDGVSIIDGEIQFDAKEKMTAVSERHGYKGLRIILSVADGTYVSSVTVNTGSQDSDIVRSKGGTVVVRSDDGRSVPVNYLMAVWI